MKHGLGMGKVECQTHYCLYWPISQSCTAAYNAYTYNELCRCVNDLVWQGTRMATKTLYMFETWVI